MHQNDVCSNNVDVDDSNDEYEYVDVDNNLYKQFSWVLILSLDNRQHDSSLDHGPCLELILAPYTKLEVVPLGSCWPSQNNTQQDLEANDFLHYLNRVIDYLSSLSFL